jgi:TatD DNase family protein
MFLTPRRLPRNIRFPSYTSYVTKYQPTYGMGKNNRKRPSEDCLLLPDHPRHSTAPIIDTHTHLVSTFAAYKQKYQDGKYKNVYDFVMGLYRGKKVMALVDVWCEAPVQKVWKEIADSAITVEDRRDKWGELEYWFVMGAYQHDDCRTS